MISLVLRSKTLSVLTARQASSISVVLREALGDKGNAGDIIKVRRGFARNFLIPQKKAEYLNMKPDGRVRKPVLERANDMPEFEVPSQISIRRYADMSDKLAFPVTSHSLKNHIERNISGKGTIKSVSVDAPLSKLGRYSIQVVDVKDRTVPVSVDVVKSHVI